MNSIKKIICLLTLFISAICFSIIFTGESEVSAASVKITYNGKTHTNTSKRMKIKYNSNLVSKTGYEALCISDTYLMPYQDIVVDAFGFNSTYDEESGIITISNNGSDITMTVSSKTATVDGETVTLSCAPLLVTFDDTGVTKLMIPMDFVIKNLHLYCLKSSSTYSIKDPYILQYDSDLLYYDGIRARMYYNHSLMPTTSIIMIKMDGHLCAPATSLLGNVFGFDVNYDESSGEVVATDADTDTTLIFKIGESTFIKEQAGKTSTFSLNVVTRLVKKNDSTYKPYIAVASVLKALDTTCKWVSGDRIYYVQNNFFFDWNGDTENENIVNNITRATATYEPVGDLGLIDLKLTGDLQDSFDRVSVERSGKTITVTIPNSVYTPKLSAYNRFSEIISDLSITESDTAVTLTINCNEVTEYTYTTSDKTLHMKFLWDYNTDSGKITNYSLTIKRPENIFMSGVSNTECYDAVNYSKKFKITIKGDHVSFFKKNPVIINNSSVKKINITLNDSGNTVITVYTKSLQGYKIYREGDYFVVSMNKPRKIYKNILVLDAGHGGFDSGASYKKTLEKNLNLKVIYTLMKGYVNKNASDLHVYWTRRTDKFITLDTRAKFAKKVGADMFISLHMNSAPSRANGTEVYYSVSNNKKSFSGITSNKMATLMKNELVKNLKTKNRGVKTAGFFVIKNNSVPAILVELGFINGTTDYKKLKNSTFQKKAANTIFDVINTLFDTYSTGR